MSFQNPIRRKLVIVGDGACGKTSLLCCFALGEFPKEYQPTIFENYVAEIRLDGKPVQLALWDTAGQEEYERLRPLSYAKSHVILIAFSIDTPDTLDNVQHKWIDEVRSICGPSVPVILVGCKSDLRPQGWQPPPVSSSGPAGMGSVSRPQRTGTGAGGKGRRGRADEEEDTGPQFVTAERGQRVASLIGARAYKECSALRMDGVDDVFEAATRASMLVRDAGVQARTRDGWEEGEGEGGCCVIC